LQVPLPSQVRAGTGLLALHVAATQTVPLAHFAHAPEPSHAPLVPHVDAASAAQALFGSWPAATFVHAPEEHSWQPPEQAVLQQTPLTQ
jgi:hypothetical protein